MINRQSLLGKKAAKSTSKTKIYYVLLSSFSFAFSLCFFFSLLSYYRCSFLYQNLVSLPQFFSFPQKKNYMFTFTFQILSADILKLRQKPFISKYYQINPIKLALLHNSLLLPSLTPVRVRNKCIPRTSPPSDRYIRQM